MILLDANVILIDIRYKTDQKYAVNRQALAALVASGIPLVVPTQVVLEVVGVMSFNTPAADVPKIWPLTQSLYNLRVTPDPVTIPNHCGCTPDEIMTQMVQKMAAGDAVIAAQIAKFAPNATALVTWNAKHFRGKLVIPVLTPEEWLLQQTPPGPTP